MSKQKLSICLLLFLMTIQLMGQKEGDKWVIGYYSLGNPEYSIMHLDFSGPSLQIEWHFDEKMQMSETAANICDSNGEAILWTNGMEIFGKHGVRIADTIAYDSDPLGYWNWFYDPEYGPFGFPEHEGALILPVPDVDNEYCVIYHAAEPHPTFGFKISKLLEARIKMNFDSTFTLIYKDSLIQSYHKWYSGPITATKHANGRDWWVTVFEADGSGYFSHLLGPDGINLEHEGDVDILVKDGLGQAAFSNQGNYLARMDAITLNEGQYITLFSFDRCTGDFVHKETFQTAAGFFTGVAFSPSERYLYADDNTHLWQWDLWAEDIVASQTLVDTFDGFVQPGWFKMEFAPLIAAPDGRIYIVPPAGSSEFMHVINRPDLKAEECRFQQHQINLTKPNGRSAPNIPNFRLGPLDGSPCDTLGLNNFPISRWRFEEDQIGFQSTIRFTDLSFYEPEEWHWDFDNGLTSDEVSPIHTFESGLYHVCLTVSNTNGSDRSCQWVEILPTGVKDEEEHNVPDISVTPNPFHSELQIRSRNGIFRKALVQLYDMHGKLVFDQPGAPIPVSIHLPAFPPGMYLCIIKERDGRTYSFKMMKK